MPEVRREEIIGSADTECSHEEHDQSDKKRVDVHHLAVDEAERAAFFFPVETFWKCHMKHGQQDEEPAGDVKM